MGFLEKIFGNAETHYVESLTPLITEIGALEKNLQELSLEALSQKTLRLKEKIAQGTPLDALAAEAFSLVREAAQREISQRHFNVQLIGGMALHQGKIAEMKTGEGKTLTATLPAYLNALEGKGVHIVTVNDYLAQRDCVWMGQIFYSLGLSVACITHDTSFIYDPAYEDSETDEQRDLQGSFKVFKKYLKPSTRKEAYEADVTYGTNNEFGFDYLRDNMASDLSLMVQRGHHYAIVDEVDSILVDEARTPLIISAPDMESSHWYQEFASIVPNLKNGPDFEVDEKLKAVSMLDEGINKIEKMLGVQDIYQERGIKYLHHLEQALKAQVIFERDRDYVVRQNEVVIVDEFTGRLLPGRRYSGGLHQALEAKEGVKVQPESVTLASITFQNYFRLYKKLAGMTGTAATSAEEFYKVYQLDVVSIPTNKPMVRKDLSDKVYKTEQAKFEAVVKEVKERHEKGQPVLVGTVSIQKNEYLGKMLEIEGIPHAVLNAKNHEREAEIIAQAGRKGAVTVATNMAGRGVDIVLGGNPLVPEEAETVRSLGGLFVLGTERHEARRIDNQLRGRSGRQGDPGSSQFFVSLEDDLIRIFGGDRLKGILERFHIPDDQAIESGLVANAIEGAQSKIEGFNFDARKHLLEYDDVLNKHREIIYKKRKEVLEKSTPQSLSLSEYVQNIVVSHGYTAEDYEKREQEIGEESMRQLEKVACLRAIDSLWVEHLENMEYLRESVRLRAYGQQDPLVEYKNEGHQMFQRLLAGIDALAADFVMQASVTTNQSAAPVQGHITAGSKVGRNDPCPCGSGLKWKRCGLINASEHRA